MSRPYHGRRRSRPNRRLRYPNGGKPPRPRSYQAFGLKVFYDLLLLGIRGRARRRIFNDFSCMIALLIGGLGAILGWNALGPLGVLIGFGGGFLGGAEYLSRNGYYRP